MDKWPLVIRERYAHIAAISIGLISYFYFADWRFLNVRNIGWLFIGANSDKVQAYLGWEFYRHANWSFPLGRNENFGLLKDNSIAFSDSIPILAILTKVFNRFLGNQFQYFGIWLLLCFVLQSLFAALIVREFTKRLSIVVFASFISVTIPFFLQRTPIHLALSGHFLILASFYLFFLSQRRDLPKYFWTTLNIVSLLIHPYIFVMVFGVFFSYLLHCGLYKPGNRKKAIIEGFVSLATIALVMQTILGIPLNSHSGSPDIPYGTHPWNLLSIVNPRDWPKFIDFYPSRDSGFDTFSYIGLGTLLLVFISVYLFLKNRDSGLKVVWKQYPLVMTSMGLLIFAITNRVGIGDIRIVVFESEFLENRLSIFRSSARMAWPFLYGLVFLSLYMIYRFTTRATAKTILCVSLLLQFADVSDASSFLFPQKQMAYRQAGPVVDPFWETVSGQYEKIFVVQNPSRELIGWPEVATIAVNIGMSTNSAYLARYDDKELRKINRQIRLDVTSGNYDKKAIYVIYDDAGIVLDPDKDSHRRVILGNKTIILPKKSR